MAIGGMIFLSGRNRDWEHFFETSAKTKIFCPGFKESDDGFCIQRRD